MKDGRFTEGYTSPARGEASRRKPKDAARGEAFRRKPKDALFSKPVRFLRKAATPPEVKLSEGRRASFRKPPEVKLPEGRSESRRTCFFQNKFASFGFLRLPSASFGKPPEVKLPEGRSASRQR